MIQNTPLDDRDAGVCVCPDGTIVVSWFTSHYADYRRYFEAYQGNFEVDGARWEAWEKALDAVTDEVVARWAPSYVTPDEPGRNRRHFGFWTMRSRDGGATWDQPALSPVYAPHGPNVAPNGDLIFLGMKSISQRSGTDNIGFARSKDQGRTWELVASLPGFPPYQGTHPEGIRRLAEPYVIALPSGKLLGMIRCEESFNPRVSLYLATSDDGGRTWTEPTETGLLGKPAHLLNHSSGTLLLSTGYRHKPFGQRVYFSQDEGKTWTGDAENVLREDALNHDLGYASTAECADGTLATLYYQIDHPGEKPALWLTRWRP